MKLSANEEDIATPAESRGDPECLKRKFRVCNPETNMIAVDYKKGGRKAIVQRQHEHQSGTKNITKNTHKSVINAKFLDSVIIVKSLTTSQCLTNEI